MKSGYSELIKNRVNKFLQDNTNSLAQFVLEFDPMDFGVYKTKGDEIYLLTGDGYRNALAKSPLLKTSLPEEVRYLYKLNIPEIDSELDEKMNKFLMPLEQYFVKTVKN
ncbi:hypothetical protein OQJ15_14655 [Fluoribacter dumoffii]|uniref:hypothetical protein n=1 Tax=Fluoribacter dumoffii TaxID=463 RepID=UPI001E35F1AC|nr:hypothetical protein [Fluoribacter dumoffii]MCW8387545.1 hypothetical protein [Fluoribacter dumoffii]MCW8497748.1 hypothetical protein [Fluoribacter dumoffii]